MTTTGRRSFLATTARAAALALALGGGAMTATPPALADAGGATPANVIVGTWWVTVTTFNCRTGVENPPIQSLLTFGADGSLIEATSSPQFAPGQRTIGQGRWERLGPGAYRAVFRAFIVSPLTLPNTAVLQRGVQTVEQGIQMTSGNRFVSDASVLFTDLEGTPAFTGCARASGVRVE